MLLELIIAFALMLVSTCLIQLIGASQLTVRSLEHAGMPARPLPSGWLAQQVRIMFPEFGPIGFAALGLIAAIFLLGLLDVVRIAIAIFTGI